VPPSGPPQRHLRLRFADLKPPISACHSRFAATRFAVTPRTRRAVDTDIG